MDAPDLKGLIAQLDRALDHRVRLGIASLLMTEDWLEFTALRGALALTDGNLASHLAALEKAGYVDVKKRFERRKPVTEYRLTAAGRQALLRHLAALEHLIRSRQPGPPAG